jgi:hypothetical protein
MSGQDGYGAKRLPSSSRGRTLTHFARRVLIASDDP